MRTLIAFYSKTGNTEKTASFIAAGLKKAQPNAGIVLQRIALLREPKNKKEEVKLKECIADWKGFDLVLIGSPVHGSSPSPAIQAYLRQCKNIKGKKAALFLTCMALPGKTIQKMSGIIDAEGGEVINYLVLKGLLGLSEKKFEKAREFGETLSKQI